MKYLFILVALAQPLCAMEKSGLLTCTSSQLIIPYLAPKTPLAGRPKSELPRVAVQHQESEQTVEMMADGQTLTNQRTNTMIDTHAVMIEPWGYPIILSRSMIITAACATYLFPFGTLKLDGTYHRLVDISARKNKAESRISDITKLPFAIDDLVVSPRGGSLVTLGRQIGSGERQAHFISLSGNLPNIHQLELPETTYPIDIGFDNSQDYSPNIIIQSGWREYRYTT